MDATKDLQEVLQERPQHQNCKTTVHAPMPAFPWVQSLKSCKCTCQPKAGSMTDLQLGQSISHDAIRRSLISKFAFPHRQNPPGFFVTFATNGWSLELYAPINSCW